MAEGPSLWERISGWFSSPDSTKTYVRIPHGRTDLAGDDEPLKPYASYFRLWLVEMFLTDRVSWGREVFPAVHSEVRLDYGGRSESISRVAEPPAPGVWRNTELVGLMPYNGGTVEIETALLSLPGKDYLKDAIGILSSFSSLITPPFGQVLDLAGKAATGLRDLVGGTGGGVHLGFHETLISDGGNGGSVMHPGYLAVVLASPAAIAPDRLSVAGDQLLYVKAPGQAPQPLQGFDYMLIRIEGRKERDDWRRTGIQQPLSQALVALSRFPPDTTGAQGYENAAVAAALVSPDLADFDRRRVIGAIRAEISDIRSHGLGAVGDAERDLDAIMAARAIPWEKSAALGLLTSDEVFA